MRTALCLLSRYNLFLNLFNNIPITKNGLNPLDYFLWGHLKSLVYTTPVENVEDLRNRIIAGCNLIRNDPGVFERVRQSMRRRLDACMLARGGYFQQFL